MNLDEVAVFVEASEAGSLAGAARRLGIPAMTASRRLAALERNLGVTLVQRSTRSLSLTPEGEAVLPRARLLLEAAEATRAAVDLDSGLPSGLLRITASVPFGARVVATMIPEFLAAYPQLRVDLMLTDVLVDIVGNGIDLAIRIAPLKDSTLVARRIAEGRRSLYASPRYLAANGTPARAADLAAHECLATSGTSHWTIGSSRQPIAGRFSSSSIEAIHAACIEGAGIALLMDCLAQADVEHGLLVPIELADGPAESRSVWAVTPPQRFIPRKVRVFTAALAARLGEEGLLLSDMSGADPIQ